MRAPALHGGKDYFTHLRDKKMKVNLEFEATDRKCFFNGTDNIPNINNLVLSLGMKTQTIQNQTEKKI